MPVVEDTDEHVGKTKSIVPSRSTYKLRDEPEVIHPCTKRQLSLPISAKVTAPEPAGRSHSPAK